MKGKSADSVFEFGRNWQRFLSVVDDERLAEAERSLRDMLAVEDLRGLRFLDVGCGSGLFSLAARRLGAHVHSFDRDPESVACTLEMRRRFLPDDSEWQIESGSILDEPYVRSLGSFDVVYAWGVLHHTGQLWKALENVCLLVRPGGTLFIAIYNDQGRRSKRWRRIKRFHCSGSVPRMLVLGFFVPYFALRGVTADLCRGKHPSRRYRDYRKARGMSLVHDWFDWLGGYPFEVATPQAVLHFSTSRRFSLLRSKSAGSGWGCNEFVFRRAADSSAL